MIMTTKQKVPNRSEHEIYTVTQQMMNFVENEVTNDVLKASY